MLEIAQNYTNGINPVDEQVDRNQRAKEALTQISSGNIMPLYPQPVHMVWDEAVEIPDDLWVHPNLLTPSPERREVFIKSWDVANDRDYTAITVGHFYTPAEIAKLAEDYRKSICNPHQEAETKTGRVLTNISGEWKEKQDG